MTVVKGMVVLYGGGWIMARCGATRTGGRHSRAERHHPHPLAAAAAAAATAAAVDGRHGRGDGVGGRGEAEDGDVQIARAWR